jgi:hypothetical protein
MILGLGLILLALLCFIITEVLVMFPESNRIFPLTTSNVKVPMLGKVARASRRYRKLEIELGGQEAELKNIEKNCALIDGSSTLDRSRMSYIARRIGEIKAELSQLRDILYPGAQEHFNKQQQQKREQQS